MLKNWDPHVKRVERNIFTKEAASLYKLKREDYFLGVTVIQAKRKRVHIKRITNPSHPAFGQAGLFAGEKIKQGEHIIDYIGLVHTDSETDEISDYDIRWTRDLCIDASQLGGEARYINDYRGIARRPNVKFENYVNGELRLGVFALVDIEKGTELCVTYGKGFWDARQGN